MATPTTITKKTATGMSTGVAAVAAAESPGGAGPANLQQKIKARIDSLSYLPTTAAVAVKFVELGKNPDADPADYARVIQADSSLSSKLLALANSSWAGVRTKVTNIRMAVNLLGLGTVRTLAISYCMAGLHNELHLSPEESEAFWESSLSKAVAARRLAALLDKSVAEEAFVAGLFQDFALPVMYAVEKSYLDVLRGAGAGVETQLQKERELFGLDHTEVGRSLAQKLELPGLFVDAVAFHHHPDRLGELVPSAALRDATCAAGLLPHAMDAWCRGDADALVGLLRARVPQMDSSTYLAEVQAEFAQLYAFFNEGAAPQAQLPQLLVDTAREAADNTTALVGQINEFVQKAAAGGGPAPQPDPQAEQAKRDPLTGVLNRGGFTSGAQELLAQAARYGTAVALCYLDVDQFKRVNERLGRAFADATLQQVVARVRVAVPEKTLVGRWGGDEFVLLLDSCTRDEATELAERVVREVAAAPVTVGGTAAPVTVSAGLLCVKPSNQTHTLELLVSAATRLIATAQSAGGNQVACRVV